MIKALKEERPALVIVRTNYVTYMLGILYAKKSMSIVALRGEAPPQPGVGEISCP